MTRPPAPRYGIAEWYGQSFRDLDPTQRQTLARIARDGTAEAPPCPFQHQQSCSKKGGVCSLQRVQWAAPDRMGMSVGPRVVTCPHRFNEAGMMVHWLAEIVGFDPATTQIAREVPFMQAVANPERAAGRIDLVLAQTAGDGLDWYGLEIQAVYFSGPGMGSEFIRLSQDAQAQPPFPDHVRRPDWRSSSAKRLMPQLQVKVPTLRRWGKKLAVAVDRAFFDALGGPSANPVRDLDEGEVLWLVPAIDADGRLTRGHWEMLSLDESSRKLLSAETVRRVDFEQALQSRLQPLLHSRHGGFQMGRG